MESWGGAVYAERRGHINRLVFTSNETILHMLIHLAPALRIKKAQAEAAIGYLSDKLTGDEFLSILNREIDRQRGGGKRRPMGQAWIRGIGIKTSRLSSMAKARLVYRETKKPPEGREGR